MSQVKIVNPPNENLLMTRLLLQKKVFSFGLAIACLLGSAVGHVANMPRIGVLSLTDPNSPLEQGLHQGLLELGYKEGENVQIKWHRTDDYGTSLKSVVEDMVRFRADVVVAFSTPFARAMVDYTQIPVVYLVGDPVGAGLAASLNKPGGNATGISVLVRELTAKRMEILREFNSRAKRIGVLFNSANSMGNAQVDEAKIAARVLGVELKLLDARNIKELGQSLRLISRRNMDAVMVTGELILLGNRTKIASAMRKARMPAIYPSLIFHDSGVLISYGANAREASRKLATYVDKILKGSKPGDIPVEQISRYEMIINERIAKEIGLPIPQTLLMRADELIK